MHIVYQLKVPQRTGTMTLQTEMEKEYCIVANCKESPSRVRKRTRTTGNTSSLPFNMWFICRENHVAERSQSHK